MKHSASTQDKLDQQIEFHQRETGFSSSTVAQWLLSDYPYWFWQTPDGEHLEKIIGQRICNKKHLSDYLSSITRKNDQNESK